MDHRDLDHRDVECERVELVGTDADVRPDLPTVTDAPPLSDAACEAPLPATSDRSGEAFSERLRPLDLTDFFALDIKPRGMVLEPIIPEKGLVMLYGARGTGKTHVAHGIGCAVATGSSFLKWRAPAPRRVLLLDGEMPEADLRARLLQVAAAGERPIARGAFELLAADRVKRGIGNLGSPAVQAELDPWLEGVELLILDNLSSLTVGLRENDSDAWSPIQQWLLQLRRRGISVLIVHHAGKTGGQRGTSRREDVLDTSFCLRRPSDHSATEGARFEVHIEKARSIHGELVLPFEARLETRDGKAAWSMKDVEDADRQRVVTLLATGMTVREIAEEIGIGKSVVHRMKQRIDREAKEEAAGQDEGE